MRFAMEAAVRCRQRSPDHVSKTRNESAGLSGAGGHQDVGDGIFIDKRFEQDILHVDALQFRWNDRYTESSRREADYCRGIASLLHYSG